MKNLARFAHRLAPLSVVALVAATAPLLAGACASNAPPVTGAPCVASTPIDSATTAATGVATVASSRAASAEDAIAFVARAEVDLRRLMVDAQRADWVRATNITSDTEAVSAEASEALLGYYARASKEAARYDGLTLPADVSRKLTLLKTRVSMPTPTDAKARTEMTEIAVKMDSMYGEGKYCTSAKESAAVRWKLAHDKASPKSAPGAVTCLDLDTLDRILRESRDADTLLDAWRGWHAIARPIRPKYERFVDLANQGAKELGFADLGAAWRAGYDMTPAEFEADTDRLWREVKPLYDELHCYVRAKLRKVYPKEKLTGKSTIPAHLLGNMWAQEWETLYDLVEPFKGEGSLDVTKALTAKKLDEKGMVRLGERFYTSLGFDPLPPTFWERSLFRRPADREVQCHASAWDVTYSDDLRIKMCVEINEGDLITIHHELGHDYYFHSYYTQPILFQDGANDGFHEAIGDTLALSVTPSYLKSLGLLESLPKTQHGAVNVMMKRALGKVAFLPFGKLVDQWRWDVFSGKTQPDKYNEAWWALRREYQGLAAPDARSEADFDAGAKYHVAANVSYTRYFLAAIYQFQFHRALCKIAGHTGPLSECSIYGSKEAGARLKAMLAMGASQPWPEALRALSGETKADATAILDYFQPLRAYLQEANKGETCGW